MSTILDFGFSPCPNDTFAFHALVQGLVRAEGFQVEPHIADVEELNSLALKGQLEMSKLSFHALAHVLDQYALMDSGVALGRGCGPLLVARPGFDLGRLQDTVVAVPGKLTTAHLLLSLYMGRAPRVEHMVFDQVMPAVAQGRVQAGVIIHEGRFTYGSYGLEAVVDLGQWWEETTGLPIPLGCIAMRRDLGPGAAQALDQALAASVAHAQADPSASRPYVLAHAQEMEPRVVQQHIDLYVNNFSLGLGDEGLAAVAELFARGRASGILPAAGMPLAMAGEKF